jgi:hypothetical protein
MKSNSSGTLATSETASKELTLGANLPASAQLLGERFVSGPNMAP